MKQSAGTLLYRVRDGNLQVLLVHPSGNYNRRAAWSIPKGLPEEGESLEAAARRETFEETGILSADLTFLMAVDYTKSRKRIHCFAGKAPTEVQPVCGSWEVDQAEFLPWEEARHLIHPDQAPLIDKLREWLNDPA
ncbi:MAG: NUDIX domain-containing protein [Pirellulales bacterium]